MAETLAKFAIIVGIVGICVGIFSPLFPTQTFLKSVFFGGVLIGVLGWSFSPEDFRDKVKVFLFENRAGKFVGYILIGIFVFVIFLTIILNF